MRQTSAQRKTKKNPARVVVRPKVMHLKAECKETGHVVFFTIEFPSLTRDYHALIRWELDSMSLPKGTYRSSRNVYPDDPQQPGARVEWDADGETRIQMNDRNVT